MQITVTFPVILTTNNDYRRKRNYHTGFFVKEVQAVSCEVRTELLNKIYASFSF
jgi:hypothetical protein